MFFGGRSLQSGLATVAQPHMIPILAIYFFAQLSPNAGDEMSGHRRKIVTDAMDNLGEPAQAAGQGR